MGWWRKAKYGMFIHWGLYSIAGGIWQGRRVPRYSEWLMYWGRIARQEYAKLAKSFNPKKFIPSEWVGLAKKAGMKYIIITAKHHDGFCVFYSKLTNFTVTQSTPYKVDIIKALASACKKENMRFGIYYSILDWDKSTKVSMLARYENFQEYFSYLKGQISELLTNYGDVSILFFDGDWIPQWTDAMGKEIENLCRSLQPNIIINNRVGKRPFWVLPRVPPIFFRSTRLGDYDTPEQMLPRFTPTRSWEVNMTMNGSFGYKSWDNNWKSVGEIEKYYRKVMARKGNLLLNVGPMGSGEIPHQIIDRLLELGQRIKNS